MANKQYSNVLDMVKDTSDDKALIESLREELAKKQISKTLVAMRCKAGLSQNQIADKMKCSQGKVSKMENLTDTELSIGDLAKYSSALGMRLEIGFSDLRMTMVDKVKWHFFNLKGLIDEMVKPAKGDEIMEKGVARFTAEAFVNITGGLLECMQRAKPQKKEHEQAIHVSNPVSLEDLQLSHAAESNSVASK